MARAASRRAYEQEDGDDDVTHTRLFSAAGSCLLPNTDRFGGPGRPTWGGGAEEGRGQHRDERPLGARRGVVGAGGGVGRVIDGPRLLAATHRRHAFASGLAQDHRMRARWLLVVLVAVAILGGAWVVRLQVIGLFDNASLAAEADLTAYREARVAGFVRDADFRLTLPFTYELARNPSTSR